MESKEAVQGSIANNIVTANQERQVWADERNRSKQVNDYLRAPVRHLAPRQQVAKESLGHQAQENQATKNPYQFARFAV